MICDQAPLLSRVPFLVSPTLAPFLAKHDPLHPRGWIEIHLFASQETIFWSKNPILRLKFAQSCNLSAAAQGLEGLLRMALQVNGAGFSLLRWRRGGALRTRAVASDSVATTREEVEKVKLGGSDLKVTKLGIGAWSWGDTSYWNDFQWDGNV